MSVGKHAVGRRPLGKLALLLALAMVVSAFAVGPLASAEKMPKSDVCHWDGDAGVYFMININENAYPAHEAHGDLYADFAAGQAAPNLPGYEFGDDCTTDLAPVWGVLDSIQVPGIGGVVTSTLTLAVGENYELKAMGTYTYWAAQLPDAGLADAHCSLRPEGYDNAGPGPQWINGADLSSPWENYLEVQTTSGPVSWNEACDLSHIYTADVVGGGSTVSFQIIDSGTAPYSDNSGFITVEIWGWS